MSNETTNVDSSATKVDSNLPPVLDIGERDSLKARADRMGLTYQPNITTDKLRELVESTIESRMEKPTIPESVVTAEVAAVPEDPRKKARDEALKLVRVNVSCMNPALAGRDGIIVMASNSLIRTQKKFVKFATPEGFHIPNIIYEQLLAATYLRITKKVNKQGHEEMISETLPAYAIQVLPELTAEEITNMRIAQNAAKSGV